MSEEARQLVYLVVLNRYKQVLLNRWGASVSLPTVEIPRFTRLAHSVTDAARDKYGIDLFLILSDRVEGEGGSGALAAICRFQNDSLDAPSIVYLAYARTGEDTACPRRPRSSGPRPP